MNYLCHLYLSDIDPSLMLGSLSGDFIKGRLPVPLPDRFLTGVALHRAQDAFAARHEAFQSSRRRLPESIGLLRPIVVDICYDHLLARHWHVYSDIPLPRYSRRVYKLMQERWSDLPEAFHPVARRMMATDWLVSYADQYRVERVLERISQRLDRRAEQLHFSLYQLKALSPALLDDFNRFLPEALAFSRNWLRQKGITPT